MTDAERLLWRHLRASQAGLKFRRRATVGPYVDFYCRKAKLAIEVDGDQQAGPDKAAYDGRRTAYLNDYGIEVPRFGNFDVLTQTPDVLQAIWGSLTLALSGRGGRGDSTHLEKHDG